MGKRFKKENLKEIIPDHSRGSVLDDFLKGNGLSQAETKLLYHCTRGEDCIIGDGTRPESKTDDNEIRASFLRYLILGGCDEAPLHQRGIRLHGAYITCRNNMFDLEAANICQEVGLLNCHIDGSLNLLGAISKSIYFDGTSLDEIYADRLTTEGGLFLRNGFQATNTVRLLGANIGGVLTCKNANFIGKENSLVCDGIAVKGDVFLSDGFQAASTVRLLGANIGSDLTCRDGVFRGDIYAGNAKIGGNIWLDKDFQISGTLSLANAIIGGNIQCTGGTFHSKNSAIHANKATIDGNVILGNCNAAGSFAFQGAKIGGDFSAQGATLSAKNCIQLRNSNIAGTFHWRDVEHAPGMLDLGGASVKTLNMDETSWQKPASIKLNNFTYQGFDALEKGANTNYWKRFLQKQPKADLTDKFRPKPFEHLASVLQGIGFEEEAKGIRIERQKRQTNFMANHDPDRQSKGNDGKYHKNLMHALNVFWRKYINGLLVDYGYRPGKAIIYLLILLALGTGLNFTAAYRGIMTPTHPLIFKEAVNGFIPKDCALNWVHFPDHVKSDCEESIPSEYSEYNSFIYTADVLLPIVNLRMEVDWAPRVVDINGNRDLFGWWVRTFEWFLIVAGWVLSLLFASAVGGIIRR